MKDDIDVEPNAALLKVIHSIGEGQWVHVSGHAVERGLAELKRIATDSGEPAQATITVSIAVSVGADGSSDATGKLKFPMPPPPMGAGQFVVDDDGQFTSGPSAEGKTGRVKA